MYIRDRWFAEDDDGAKTKTPRHGQGRRWQLDFVDNAGKRQSPTFVTKAAAETRRREVEADLLRGTYVDPAVSKTLFCRYAEDSWVPSQLQHAPGTAALTEQTLRLHILPTFGDTQIGRIRKAAIQGWVNGLAGTHAPGTVRRIYGVLAAVLGAAVEDDVIGRSPCRGINLPAVTKGPVVPLPVLAVEALIEATPEYWRAAVVLAAGAGLREGEVLGLSQDRIEWLHRRVRVDRQAQSPAAKGMPFLRPTKTQSSDRTVPLGDVVLSALAEHVRKHPPALVEVDEYTERTKGARSKRAKSRLLWTSRSGGVVRGSSFRKTFSTAVTRAEKALRERAAEARKARDKDLADRCEAAADHLAAGVDVHDCRHFFASLLIHAGASVKVVQARLGHTSPVVTLSVYAHLWPDSEDDTRQAVDSVLGGLGGAGTVHSPSSAEA
jgi:integrase